MGHEHTCEDGDNDTRLLSGLSLLSLFSCGEGPVGWGPEMLLGWSADLGSELSG